MKEELGKKWKARKALQMRLVQEGKESTRKARLPGVARKTEEADSKGREGRLGISQRGSDSATNKGRRQRRQHQPRHCLSKLSSF